MKYLKKIIIILLVVVSCSVNVLAEEGDNGDNGKEDWIDDTVTLQMIQDELDRIALESGNKDEAYSKCMASAVLTDDMKSVYCKIPSSNGNQLFDLVLDFNPEIRAQETSKRFYTTLWNSTQTASYVNWDWFDWGTSLVTVVGMFLLSIIETIGGLISVVVLFIANIATTNVIAEILRQLFEMLYTFLFGNYTNAVVILGLIFIIGLARAFIERAENLTNLSVILAILRNSILTFLFVLAVAIPGRQVFYYIDDVMNKSVAQVSNELFSSSEEFKGTTTGTILKAKIYYTLQEQPFMLRHFGALSEESIGTKFGISTDQATTRYEKLLFDPSRANAKNEMKNLGNKVIPYDSLTVAVALLSSLFMLVHKVLMGMVFAGLSLVILLANTFKEVLIGLTFLTIFSFALSREVSAAKIIGNRLTWIFVLGILPLGVTISMELVIRMISMLGDQNFMLIFIADLVLVFASWVIWENKGKIVETLTKLKEPLTGMINGTYRLSDGYNDLSSMFSMDKDSFKDRNSSNSSMDAPGMNTNANIDKLNKNDLADEKTSSYGSSFERDQDELAEIADPKLTAVPEPLDKLEKTDIEKETIIENKTESNESVKEVETTPQIKNSEIDAGSQNNSLSDSSNEKATNRVDSSEINEIIKNQVPSSDINITASSNDSSEVEVHNMNNNDQSVSQEENEQRDKNIVHPDELSDFQKAIEKDDFELNKALSDFKDNSDVDLFDVSSLKPIESDEE